MNGGEFVVIALLAALLLGPERLPDLARQAAHLIRRGRDFATGASAQMKDEMGVDLEGVDWRRYDPRQYHPRRIVQNALSDAFDDEPRTGSTAVGAAGPPGTRGGRSGATAAKRAETSRPPAAPRPATHGPSSPSREAARTGTASATSPRRPSPPPTTWAEAARRAGVDDDAT